MMKNQLWEELPNLSSESRSYHTSTLYQNYIITYAGWSENPPELLSDIKILNVETSFFEDFILKGDQPYKRERHSACIFDLNKILIFGGFNDKVLHELAIISIEEKTPLIVTYKKVMTKGGEDFVRCSHSAEIYQNKMYIFGGRYQHSPSKSSNQLWCLDLDAFTWKNCETTGDRPEARAFHCSAIFDKKLYIFGGYSDTKKSHMQDSHILSFETMNWEKLVLKESSLLAKTGALFACVQEHIFIIGGDGSADNHKIQTISYHLKENTLTCTELQGDDMPSQFGTATIYRNTLILWGGIPMSDNRCVTKIICLKLNRSHQNKICKGKNYSFSGYAQCLLGSEELADTHFCVGGERIPAHKLVLSFRCKYFMDLFTSKMKESNASEIQIPDVKLETFKAFLGFLYENEVALNESLAMDLYELSDKYLQFELADVCEKYLSNHVSVDNLGELIDFTEKFGTDILRDAIVEYIGKNLQEIKKNQDRYKIPQSLLLDVASQIQKKLETLQKTSS